MPKLGTFFTFRPVGWLGGKLVWPVSKLKSLQFKYICWVLPFRDYIPNFNQIGRKMPKLCTLFTFRLVGWLGRLGGSDHNIRIGCKAAYPNKTSLKIWSKSVKAFNNNNNDTHPPRIIVDLICNWSRRKKATRVQRKRKRPFWNLTLTHQEIIENIQNSKSKLCIWKTTTRAVDWCKFQVTKPWARHIFFTFFTSADDCGKMRIWDFL